MNERTRQHDTDAHTRHCGNTQMPNDGNTRTRHVGERARRRPFGLTDGHRAPGEPGDEEKA